MNHPKMICRVITSYQPKNLDPLVVQAGEALIVGNEDKEYPGWFWCTDPRGKSAWVPKDCIEGTAGTLKATYDYSAIELLANAGEEVALFHEKFDWGWCTNARNESGWLPLANLERLNAESF